MSLQDRIESAISRATGESVRFTGSRSSYGGSINTSRVVTLSNKLEVFIKTHAAAARYPGMFPLEFAALGLLAAAGVIRVPRAIVCGDDFIVMEAFQAGQRAADWPERMGRQLALLHQATRSRQFGFEHDNYLGLTRQVNTWTDNWPAFWRDCRLGYQLDLFAQKTTSDDKLLNLGGRLLAGLDKLLPDDGEPAVLLHGDLWSGNAAADEQGAPIIYDPASYYGHREAEIGMMRMFGGFGPRCEAAYQEVWPFAAGVEERIALYRLYHELNHLNLFGSAYYAACIATMESLL